MVQYFKTLQDLANEVHLRWTGKLYPFYDLAINDVHGVPPSPRTRTSSWTALPTAPQVEGTSCVAPPTSRPPHHLAPKLPAS